MSVGQTSTKANVNWREEVS